MKYVVLDLEWNSVFSHKCEGYFNEIIQFGAVRLDAELHETDRFATFVRPTEGDRLTELVEQLTNIRSEDLESGLPFMQAFHAFCAFCSGAEPDEPICLMSWGDCDIRELIHNYEFFTGSPLLPLNGTYLNLQNYFQCVQQLPMTNQIGLSNAAVQMGIPVDGVELHHAIDDSVVTAECLRRIFTSEQELAKAAVPMNECFFRRMAFKNRMITDPGDPLVDPAQFEFRCPKCGGALDANEDWSVHNKQFYRNFFCTGCSRQFRARVQFKQKFDGVQVRRSLNEKRPKPKTPPVETETAAHAD